MQTSVGSWVCNGYQWDQRGLMLNCVVSTTFTSFVKGSYCSLVVSNGDLSVMSIGCCQLRAHKDIH